MMAAEVRFYQVTFVPGIGVFRTNTFGDFQMSSNGDECLDRKRAGAGKYLELEGIKGCVADRRGGGGDRVY